MQDHVNELLNNNVPVGINTHVPQDLTQDFGSWMLVKKPSHNADGVMHPPVEGRNKIPTQTIKPKSVTDTNTDNGSRFEILANEALNDNILERAINLADQDSRNFESILDETCQISTNSIFDTRTLEILPMNPLQIPSQITNFQLGLKK